VAILLALADAPGLALSFGDLRRVLRYSEGNLICHLRRLADFGAIEVRSNGARGRASRSSYHVTPAGWERLAAAGREFAAVARAIELALAQREPDAPPLGAGADASAGTRGDSTDEASKAIAAVLSLVDERFSGPD
jgi:DNA-binding MarR family transcriptional regulator